MLIADLRRRAHSKLVLSLFHTPPQNYTLLQVFTSKSVIKTRNIAVYE